MISKEWSTRQLHTVQRMEYPTVPHGAKNWVPDSSTQCKEWSTRQFHTVQRMKYPTVTHGAKSEVPDSSARCKEWSTRQLHTVQRMKYPTIPIASQFQHFSLRYVLILSYYLHLGLRESWFPTHIVTKILQTFLISPTSITFPALHMPLYFISPLKPCNYNKLCWNKTDMQHEWESDTYGIYRVLISP